jgi:hypothetical protein
MIELLADELRLAIQQLHGSPSRLVERVPLADECYGKRVADREVYVFELLAHPSAVKCYAWATLSETSSTIMHAVLHSETANSPEAAVRSVLLADRKAPVASRR